MTGSAAPRGLCYSATMVPPTPRHTASPLREGATMFAAVVLVGGLGMGGLWLMRESRATYRLELDAVVMGEALTIPIGHGLSRRDCERAARTDPGARCVLEPSR